MDTRFPTSLRRRLIRLGQGGAYWSGLVQCLPARGRAAILMYHSVAPPEAAPYVDFAWRMSAECFEEQVRFLTRHRRVVALSELVERLRSGVDPEPGTVVLTFDDGYRDNLEVAAPILRRHGAPATLFLATAYVGRGETQWVDRLYATFTTRSHSRCQLPVADSVGLTRDYDLRNPVEWRHAYHQVALRLLEADPGERDEILSGLEAQLKPVERAPRLTLDWSEVRELATRFPELEIGVHTAEHVDLSSCGDEQVRAELRTCLDDVERELGVRPRSFSFPYGRSSARARQIAAELGLACAMGPSGPWLVDAGTDRYCLPRLDALMSPTQLRLRTHPGFGTLPAAVTNRG
jgi:peptidoglycan/xylan/chitin deacetylase (PgdA/CDA1 family)